MADQARTIRIPVHMVEVINKLGRIQRELLQDLGREPTPEELAKEMDGIHELRLVRLRIRPDQRRIPAEPIWIAKCLKVSRRFWISRVRSPICNGACIIILRITNGRSRWRQRGRPLSAEFVAYCASYGEDRFDLRSQLRLEIQYALRCRVDANRTRTTPRSIKPLLDHLSASGIKSLLERPLADSLAGLPTAAALHTPCAFLGYAIECLLDLRDGTGWDSEYERDVWLLRRLGVADHDGSAGVPVSEHLHEVGHVPRSPRHLRPRWGT